MQGIPQGVKFQHMQLKTKRLCFDIQVKLDVGSPRVACKNVNHPEILELGQLSVAPLCPLGMGPWNHARMQDGLCGNSAHDKHANVCIDRRTSVPSCCSGCISPCHLVSLKPAAKFVPGRVD